MGDIDRLVRRAARTADCSVSPVGKASVALPAGLALPADLAEFFAECGGVSLFGSSAYSVRILSPDEMIPANIAVLGAEFPEDRSSGWFVVAALPNGDFISIDLAGDRLGHCYDSSHEVHGVVGSCAIVARSFTQLFESLLNAGGGYWFWLADDFEPLGDAYDQEDRDGRSAPNSRPEIG